MSYDRDNIFARILRKEVPCKKVYEDEQVLAIEDIAPAAPMHVLVLPKGEYISFHDFTAKATAGTIANFFATVRRIAEQLELERGGYRLIMNHGADAGQLVPHFHVHILGGRPLGKLLPQ